MPPGGDGVYFVSTFALVGLGEQGRFDMRLNDDVICSIWPDHFNSGDDAVGGSCSAVVDIVAGKTF